MLTKLDVLRREYNLARTTFYHDQTEANELRMDTALRSLLYALDVREEEVRGLCSALSVLR